MNKFEEKILKNALMNISIINPQRKISTRKNLFNKIPLKDKSNPRNQL